MPGDSNRVELGNIPAPRLPLMQTPREDLFADMSVDKIGHVIDKIVSKPEEQKHVSALMASQQNDIPAALAK